MEMPIYWSAFYRAGGDIDILNELAQATGKEICQILGDALIVCFGPAELRTKIQSEGEMPKEYLPRWDSDQGETIILPNPVIEFLGAYADDNRRTIEELVSDAVQFANSASAK